MKSEQIKEILITLNHAKIFISTRQKMHEAGQDLYQECIDKVQTEYDSAVSLESTMKILEEMQNNESSEVTYPESDYDKRESKSNSSDLMEAKLKSFKELKDKEEVICPEPECESSKTYQWDSDKTVNQCHRCGHIWTKKLN